MSDISNHPELTPKIWKIVQIVGALVAVGGAIYLSNDVIVGWSIVAIGTIVFVVGRAIAWWRYG